MDADAIFLKLQAAGAFLLLVNGQLAVKEDSITGVPVKVLGMLTENRDQLQVLLLERELLDTKPHIDEQSDMGQGGKGCLVIPTDCAPRYKIGYPVCPASL